MFDLPSMDGVTEVVVDKDVVEGRKEPVRVVSGEGKKKEALRPISRHAPTNTNKSGNGSAFRRRCGLDRLVYAEEFPTIEKVIARKKATKAWKRAWKIELLEKSNPEWTDCSATVLC